MAPSADIQVAASQNSPSSKKRKIAATASETSKKRRKQDKSDTSAGVDEQLAAAKTDKKDKKDKKKKKKESNISDALSPQEVPATQDVELPDAPSEISSIAETTQNGGLDGEEDALLTVAEDTDLSLLQSQEPSCFYEKRMSLQLPVPAVSLTSSTSSLLSLHLAPLLLTYFPPANGIVLSFSDPILSAIPENGVNLPIKPPKSGEIPRNPPDETFAKCADGYGVCWVWLTVTFTVFKPESGDELKGWTNVSSQRFVGLVSYNYFQTAVGSTRIPKTWTWTGPSREPVGNKKKSRKGKLQGEGGISTSQDEIGASQDTMSEQQIMGAGSGSFVDSDGNEVSATQTFRVVDVEMVPGHEKDKWTLQIDGSLLSSEQEAVAVAEERQRFEQLSSRSRSGTPGPGTDRMPLMSGALSFSREVSPD